MKKETLMCAKIPTLHDLRIYSGLSLLDIERKSMISRGTIKKLERGENAYIESLLSLGGSYNVSAYTLIDAWHASKREASNDEDML